MGYIEGMPMPDKLAPYLIFTTLLLTLIVAKHASDPLRRIPGPLLARCTSLWLHYHAWAGTQCSAIQALHARYGPVVRIGPNDVHISDGEALWPIYMDKGGMVKSGYYNTFDIDGHATVFTTLELGQRAGRLKAIQSMFSFGATTAAKGVIQACAARMIERLACARDSPTKTVDVLNLTRSYAIDAVSAYVFAAPYNSLQEAGSEMSASPFVDFFVGMSRFFHVSKAVCNAIERVLDVVKPDYAMRESSRVVDAYLSETVEAKMRQRAEGKDDDSYPARLLAVGLSKAQVLAECKDAVFAGTDSTGNNLATILWYLAAQPHTYANLHAELARNDAGEHKDGQALPYLTGVVKEALRLSMAISCRLPRVVPAAGFSHADVYMPPGTNVGLSAYQLHLDPAVFPDPHQFRPERWAQPSAHMQRDFMPFGKGARACIARNLAMLELYVATEAVVRSGVLEGARTTVDSIESLEWFNARVKSGTIELAW